MTSERSGSFDRKNETERKRIDYLKARIRNMIRQAAERNYDDVSRQEQAKQVMQNASRQEHEQM